MRRVGIIIAGIVGIVVIAVLVFAATFNVNKYRGTIQSQLQKHLGRSVTLGDMHLRVFPPKFRVQDLAIADDTNFSADTPFIKAQVLDVSVKLLPLLHKTVEINSLDLQRPSVNLIKNQAGVWNFASLGHSEQVTAHAPGEAPTAENKQPPSANQAPEPHSTSPNPSQPSEQQISLSELTIADGQVSLLDQQKSKVPSLYDHIDVSLKNFSPNKPFTLDAAAHISGAGSQEVTLQGEGGPVVQGQPALTRFHGTLNVKQVGIADLAKFLNSPALAGTDGILTGQTKIESETGKLAAKGETNIQSAKVHGMELGYPISAQYDLTDDLALDVVTLHAVTVKLGEMPVKISGTVNSKASPPLLDVNMQANNVSIAEAGKLAAASGMALSQGTMVNGNVNANIRARGAADRPAMTGTIIASNVQMSGKDIAQPVQIPSVNLNLTPAEIKSNPFSVISGGTTVNSQLSIRNYLSPTPTVDAVLRAPNAQLPAILAMAKAYGVTSLDKITGAGTMNLDMHASGPIKAISTSEIEKAVNGTVNVNFNNVKYSGADLNHELASIAGFLGSNPTGQASRGVTNILKMTGDIVVKNGMAQTNNLQAQLDMGNVGAAGTANLINEALNMRVTAVLSQGFSQKVGGQNIGGFMKTALANPQGELVIPALVTGTFSNPRFSPDVQQLAQMKLKNLVPNINNPASVAGTLQNLLGGSTNAAQGQQPSKEQQPQQNPVQQLMGIFGKKKNQEQPQPPK